MSPFILSDADLATKTDLAALRRARITVADAHDDYAATLIDDYLAARSEGLVDQMALIRDHAAAFDPSLVDEFDGFDYPAAA
jgi:hypothetical protein